MKKTKLLSGFLVALAILFSSCSKDDESLKVENDKAYLSFHTFLNDLTQKQQNKQVNSDIPECTAGTPAFVDVILTLGDVYVAGSATTPLRLNLNPNAPDTDGDGSPDYFTEESATLELIPGTYTLEYFTVLDEDENVLWIAPINDNRAGGIDDMVGQSLPMDIELGAGVKKYQNVEVVCFDDRNVIQYGYLFYELNEYQLIEFCIFGNYCDETGRHAEYVSFSVDVWKYSDNPLFPKGEQLHSDEENFIVVTDYEDYADTAAVPLCLNLPDGPGLDEYYFEITLHYPGPENTLIRSGLISDADVRGLFRENGTMDYYHFREGNCNMEDSPNILSDHRDLTNYDWEFIFDREDYLWVGEISFNSDGTAVYSTPDVPGSSNLLGQWAFYNGYLFYDLEGDNDPAMFYLTGQFNEEKMTGTFTYEPWENGNWTATRK